MPEPPDGKDRFQWDTRRARVLILGGQYQEGYQVLHQLLASPVVYDEAQINRLLQVVFDLQHVEQHQLAIELLVQLEHRISDVLVQREIKF